MKGIKFFVMIVFLMAIIVHAQRNKPQPQRHQSLNITQRMNREIDALRSLQLVRNLQVLKKSPGFKGIDINL